MNYAIILAGGIGKRSGELIPKQFFETGGKPLLVYTLEKFQTSKCIDSICVVTLQDYIHEVELYKERYQITKLNRVVSGGKSGIGSVLNGFNALLDIINDEDIILFHDAVRPFITQELIEDNIQVANLHDNAMTAVECVETLVKCSQNGKSDKMIDRDQLYRVQTPQTFRVKILKELFRGIDIDSVTEPSIFAYYINQGGVIYCSKGSERNIKITYPEDIGYFKEFFK